MRHIRRTFVVAVALAFAAPPPAVDARPIVAPSSAHDLTTALKTLVELPADVNPLYGVGTNPCVEVAPKTLLAITFGDEVTCRAESGTAVITGAMHFCSTFDPVGSPFHADHPKEGRECARSADVSPESGLWVSLDGGPQVDLFRPQYASHTPPTRVQLPVDNAFGVPPQLATIYGFGRLAKLRNLGVGRHTYVTTVEVFGQRIAFRHVVEITPG